MLFVSTAFDRRVALERRRSQIISERRLRVRPARLDEFKSDMRRIGVGGLLSTRTISRPAAR